MKRIQFFEIEDQFWCPRTIRDATTDFLQFSLAKTKSYAPVVPILVSALQRTGTQRILDLCSGAAGPWLWLQPALAEMGLNVGVRLTDKYPNTGALTHLRGQLNQAISYHPEPVDATAVPEELAGFRTMFSSFHHLPPLQARAVLADAVRCGQGIAVFEGTERSTLALLVMLLVPFMVLFMTPFIRPFRWSRLLWTYLIPLVPLVALFDALVSCLRTYSLPELRELKSGLGADDYVWEIGALKKPPIPVTYLIGVPRQLEC
jgi:hypothetical protein